MPTAFVLSGGASLGAVQVGMAQALEEAGVRPELVVGSSVGAINGAWLAQHGSAAELGDIWRSLKRAHLFPLRPLAGLRGLAGRTSHLVPQRGLRRLLETHIGFARLEDAAVPFSVIATDAQTGEEVHLVDGPAIKSILASAALPAVLPPVEIGRRMLIDGGVSNNTPIMKAVEAGAREVWVLSTGYSCRLPSPPRTAIAMAMQSIALLVQQRFVLETTRLSYPVPVHLIPPPCPISVTPIDFSQTDQLIERALTGTRQWLANGRPDAMPLLASHPDA